MHNAYAQIVSKVDIAIKNTEQLLPSALLNQKIASDKFRINNYIISMRHIIEGENFL